MKMIPLVLVLMSLLGLVSACGDSLQVSVTSSRAAKSLALAADFTNGCANAVLTGNTIKITFNNFEANNSLVNCNANNIVVPIPAGTQLRIVKASSKAVVDPERGQDNRRIEIETLGLGARGKFINLFEDVPSQVSGAVDQDHSGNNTVFTSCGRTEGRIRLSTGLTSSHGSGGDIKAPLRVKLNSVSYELESRLCPS